MSKIFLLFFFILHEIFKPRIMKNISISLRKDKTNSVSIEYLIMCFNSFFRRKSNQAFQPNENFVTLTEDEIESNLKKNNGCVRSKKNDSIDFPNNAATSELYRVNSIKLHNSKIKQSKPCTSKMHILHEKSSKNSQTVQSNQPQDMQEKKPPLLYSNQKRYEDNKKLVNNLLNRSNLHKEKASFDPKDRIINTVIEETEPDSSLSSNRSNSWENISSTSNPLELSDSPRQRHEEIDRRRELIAELMRSKAFR